MTNSVGGFARGILGVVLAGGESRRFGGDKALSPLAGRPMAAWALDAMAPHLSFRGIIANDPEIPATLGVPGRPDLRRGMGPLGGILTALAWASEEGMEGVFVLACDLPLVRGELVGRILEAWDPGEPAVIPESPGPLGFEPLCAGYRIACLPTVEALVNAGALSVKGLLDRVGGTLVPLSALGGEGALALAFTNLNTPAEARRVEALLSGEGA